MSEEKIHFLLNQVDTITKKNEEFLDATGSRFNMFRVCGVNHYENTHSAILAEFLNPNGTHGVKEEFLKCFLLRCCDEFTFDGKDMTVRTEFTFDKGRGRIDILIEDKRRHAIIIENKVYAKDGWKQLQRYDEFAKKTYGKGNYKILYLTLWGDSAEEYSGQQVDYKRISYKDDIIKWLEDCVRFAVHLPTIRETLFQYINHLKSLTGQAMSKKYQDEIVELLCKPENYEATSIIWARKDDAEKCLANKFVIQMYDEVNNMSDKFNYLGGLETERFEFDVKNKDNVLLYIRPLAWSKFQIGFQIWASQKRFVIGILPKPNENQKRDELFAKLRQSFPDANNDYWAYCKIIYYSYCDKDAPIRLRDRKMVEIFKTEIENILKLTKDLTDML